MKRVVSLIACLSAVAAQAQAPARPPAPPQTQAPAPAQQPVLRNLSENTFAPLPQLPSCVTLSVQSGDPTTGPATLLLEASTGCTIPWHWHTWGEHLMVVSGSAKVEMRGGPSAVLGPGGYALLPPKHVHQFTCVAGCTGFLRIDGAFDIHYVDPNGKEIPIESVVGKRK